MMKHFGFWLTIGIACLVIGTGVHYAFSHTAPSSAPSVPPKLSVVEAMTLSSTTPERMINALTPADVIPPSGKFIVADLVHMKISLYQDGAAVAEYPILTKGKPGTPYETPSGIYKILSKETDHLNRGAKVHMPYSMQFYGNYFIHGWPIYTDGTPVASTYSGGCIRLSTDDAARVYAFADKGIGIFVYDTGSANPETPLVLASGAVPPLSAASYLIADIDTGDVYAEQNATVERPIASVTKLMTALVANETIMFDHPIIVPRGNLKDKTDTTDTTPETFVVGDLLYPLLMESNNTIADALAHYYGSSAFIGWMNSQAQALDMASTTFADASGISAENVSTPEDLYRLAVYLANKKSFIWKITRTPTKTITTANGASFTFANFNVFSDVSSFVGGKVGHTLPAQDTMVSVFSMPIDGSPRRVAIIVLGSLDYTSDTRKLADWFNASATRMPLDTACVSCSESAHYRKIEL